MFTWEKRDPSAPTPRADFIVCWMKDLVDIKTKQTTECLHNKKGMCCLGVATNTAGFQWFWDIQTSQYIVKSKGRDYGDYLPRDLSRFLKTDSNCTFPSVIKIRDIRFRSLMHMNDQGLSFRQIANVIQSECENLFKELSSQEVVYIKGFKIPTRQQLRDEAKKNKG